MVKIKQNPPPIPPPSWIFVDFSRDLHDALPGVVLSTTCEPGQDVERGSIQWREWPPPLNLVYCAEHFLQECLLYHSREKKRIDELTWTDPVPPRVQPRRAAKTAVATKRESNESNELEARLRDLKSKLNLHFSLEEFKAAIEAVITPTATQPATRLQSIREGVAELFKGGESTPGQTVHQKRAFKHARCPFTGKVGVECRFCDRPRHANAPVAPMCLVEADDINERQVIEFGGIKFAIDTCGTKKKIVLMEMGLLGAKELDELARLAEKIKGLKTSKKKPQMKSNTILTRSKKRKTAPSPVSSAAGAGGTATTTESPEPADEPAKRRRAVRGRGKKRA